MTILARANQLELRLTRDPAEITAAQQLRYRVFYEEMGAVPTAEMQAARLDADLFDRSPTIWSSSIWTGHPRERLAWSAATGCFANRSPKAAAASIPRASSTSARCAARVAR